MSPDTPTVDTGNTGPTLQIISITGTDPHTSCSLLQSVHTPSPSTSLASVSSNRRSTTPSLNAEPDLSPRPSTPLTAPLDAALGPQGRRPALVTTVLRRLGATRTTPVGVEPVPPFVGRKASLFCRRPLPPPELVPVLNGDSCVFTEDELLQTSRRMWSCDHPPTASVTDTGGASPPSTLRQYVNVLFILEGVFLVQA